MFASDILYIVPRADGCKSLSALFVLKIKKWGEEIGEKESERR